MEDTVGSTEAEVVKRRVLRPLRPNSTSSQLGRPYSRERRLGSSARDGR
jgi:hypothetical protein